MKCCYCEEQIRDGSEICPYCGKQQNTGRVQPNMTAEEYLREEKRDTRVFLGVIAAVLIYLILLFKMVLSIGGYLLGCGILALVLIAITKLKKIIGSKQYRRILICFSCLLAITTIGLRIMYEAKVDAAEADIPAEGSVRVIVTMDEEFTSPFFEGLVLNPYSNITIENIKHEGTSVVTVTLNKAYPVEIGAGHEGRSGVANSGEWGSCKTSICLTPELLKKEASFSYEVALSGFSKANVRLTFRRFCSFWDVIFY